MAALFQDRTSLIIAALMLAASFGAVIAEPRSKSADMGPVISLETMVPRQFGEWREEPERALRVVNPQAKELLDRLYSQVLTRTFVNASGYRIMLSLAYGSDQRERGSLQAHKPEVCYPAQGFVVQSNDSAMLRTATGEIPVRRLYATMGVRHEPLTYWFTVGDTVVQGKLHKRLVDLRFGLTGLIPDGLLFRVSSIDRDLGRAFLMQDQFINQLLDAVPPTDRARLTGLGIA